MMMIETYQGLLNRRASHSLRHTSLAVAVDRGIVNGR